MEVINGVKILSVGDCDCFYAPTKEEAIQANLANIKRIYHEKKTTTNKVGRPSLSLEDKIKKIEEKHNMVQTKQG